MNLPFLSKAGVWCLLWAGLLMAAHGQEADPVPTVSIDGRKASATGILAKLKEPGNVGKMTMAKQALTQRRMRHRADFAMRGVGGLVVVEKVSKRPQDAVMSDADIVQTIKELKATGLYEYVEPDWIVTIQQTPTDTAFTNGSLWGLRNTGQNGGTSGVDVNAVPAWALTTGSPTVVVGVVDTGIRHTHQDLAGNMWRNPGEIADNGIDDDSNGYIDDVHGINGITGSGNPMDDNNHGSHCAGTIAATGNDAGQHVGVAYNVKLMALKFLNSGGSGQTSDAIKCIDYGVAKGAHILSNSWGGGPYSQAMRDSIAAANTAGVLFVAAAGNAASNNDVWANYPSNYDPANVVAVAAVSRTGALASFSSYGQTTVDLAAPGVSILSSTATSNTSYDLYDGTSMATPHVAGVAALIKSRFPSASVLEIKSRLLATTRPLASLTGKTATGGMVDAHAALTVAVDGVLELRAAAEDNPVHAGANTAFYVTVTDLFPVIGATVSGRLGTGSPATFLDNGVSPDITANDGIYSANLQVPATGSSVTLNVGASTGGAPAAGAFDFQIISPPPNDDFANRILLQTGTTQTTGTNRLATLESGEPLYPRVAGGKSVWWEWASGTTGEVTITTAGSSYDTTLAVYSGSPTLGSLVHVDSNDDASGLTSEVTFSVTNGTRYYLQVNGYAGDEGSITLNYPSPAAVDSPPIIVSQPSGGILVAGDPLTLSVTANGTAPLTYQWYLDGTPIPGATDSSHSVASVTAAHQGGYTVRITNPYGNIVSSVAFVGVDPVSVRPANDAFSAAQPLPGATGRVSGTNQRSSGEIGEPNHAGASTPLESVWYLWTAPANGVLSVDTYGTSFDTTLAFYTGTDVGALTQAAANNDSGGPQSFVSATVTAGQVLRIAVDGAGTSEGVFTLNYHFQPQVAGLVNDAFANRTVLPGAPAGTTGSNIGAAGEVGEPSHTEFSSPVASVWWSWTAPASGVAVIDTLGSNFDTELAIYTGSSVGALTLVAANGDAGGPQSRVSFICVAGTPYVIAVDGRGTSEGTIALNIASGSSEPEIVVEQPVGMPLVDGLASLSMGSVATGQSVTRAFTVRNTGGARLNVVGVGIDGASADDFAITSALPAYVEPGGTASFTLRFLPTALGSRNAMLRVISNDGDENTFDVALGGIGVPPVPEIAVEQPASNSLVDGTSSVDFGFRPASLASSLVFTVRNVGTAPLSLSSITIDGTHAADFTVTAGPVGPVAIGGSTTFTVQFTPGDAGARAAVLRLASNDADENPFDINLSGTGYVPPAGLEFQVLSLQTSGAAVVDHDSLTGGDRGGIAVSTDRVFLTGDLATSRHSAADLTGGTSVGRVSDGLCGDVGTGQVYVLASNGIEIGGGGTVNQLIQLDPVSGALTTNVIPLTTEITLSNGSSGVFSGYGRMLIYNGARMYDVLLPSGVVTDLGPMTRPAWRASESWAVWGVAEYLGGALHVAYRDSTSSSIVRTRVPDGVTQTIATFTNLSDMANWTVSPSTNRWYFHHEFASQFGSGAQTLGYANATFSLSVPTQPPVIVGPLTATAFTGLPFNYQIRAARFPTVYAATGLPAGLVLNTATGLISGATTANGTYGVTISATNEAGTTTGILALTVTPALATVSLFADPAYVSSASVSQLHSALSSLNCHVTPFSGVTVPEWNAAFAASQIVVVPSLKDYLSLSMLAATINARINVDKGLVVAGSDYYDESFFYELRGWSLTESGSFGNGALNLTKSILVPGFSSSPATLASRTLTHVQSLSNMPAQVRPLYVTGIHSAAFVARRVGSIGYDWISGQDSGWNTVLKDMLVVVKNYVDFPEIAVEYQGSPLVDGNTNPSVIGNVAVGAPVLASFTIRNDGSSALTSVSVTVDGANAADFSISSSPAASVAASDSTTFTVRFTPSAAGYRYATLRVASNDADENPFDIYIVGSAFAGVPEIAVEQPAGFNLVDGAASVAFGSVTVNSGASLVFTIRSTGTGSLTGVSAAVTGANAGDFVVTSAPATPVPPSSSTTFTVRFTPSGTGARAAALRIASNDADENPFDITLGGTGLPATPEIAVEQPAGTNLVDGSAVVACGHAPVGGLSQRVFTVRNVGTGPLTGLAVVIDGTHASDFTVAVPPAASVDPSGSTTFTVSFSPLATGSRTAALHLASNDADENPFDIALTGTTSLILMQDDFDPGLDVLQWSAFGGTATANTYGQAAGVGSTGNNLHFDGTGSRFATTVPLNTLAGGEVSFKIALANGFTSPWETADPGEEVVLEYSNNGTTFTQIGGSYSSRTWQSVVVAIPVAAQTSSTRFRWRQISNSGTNFDHWAIEDVQIRGLTPATPEIAVEQPAGTGLTDGSASASFGSLMQGDSTSLVFTLRNPGSLTLTGVAASIDGTHAADFVVTSAPPSSLAPGGSATFSVRFTAGTTGARGAQLHISSNDADENPFDIALTGTCVAAPAITGVNPSSGTTLGGTSVTILGTAFTGASAVSFGGTAASSFAVVNDTTITATTPARAAGAVNVTVTTSTGTGTAPGAFTYLSLQPEIVVEQPVGTDLADGIASASFGAVAGPITKTFTVRNTGNASLTGVGVLISGTQAADFTVVSAPAASLAVSGETTFTISFTPAALGGRAAQLRITSNDADENPFDITLSGSGVTAVAEFDSWVPVALPVPERTATAMPHHDGVPNLMKYAFNMNASQPDNRVMVPGTGTAGLPLITPAQQAGINPAPVFRYEFLRRIGSGLVYTPERSSTLAPGSWTPLTSAPTILPVSAQWERVIYEEPVLEPMSFGRVQVTLPAP